MQRDALTAAKRCRRSMLPARAEKWAHGRSGSIRLHPCASLPKCRDQRRLWERFAIAMRRRGLQVQIAAASRPHSAEGHANRLGTSAAAHKRPPSIEASR